MAERQFTGEEKCEHCGHLNPLEILHTCSQVGTTHDEDFGPYSEGDVYQLLLCPACRKLTLRRHYYHEPSHDPRYGLEYEVLYPVGKKSPLGLPPAIQRSYEAAQRVKRIDANSFAVLVGRLLEMICLDRSAVGDTLYKQLADLATKGEIPSKLVAVADVLRGFRNVGAHAALGELTENEVPIVEDLTRAIIEYVYTAPHLAATAQRQFDLLKQQKAP